MAATYYHIPLTSRVNPSACVRIGNICTYSYLGITYISWRRLDWRTAHLFRAKIYCMHEDGFLYIEIYVDDEESELFLGLLKEKFKITFGSLENFLEMQIKCQSYGAIFVSKYSYTKKILKSSTWLKPKLCRCLNSRRKWQPQRRQRQGSISWGSGQPHLCCGSNTPWHNIRLKAAWVIDRPAEKEWNEVKPILRYFRSTTKFGLRYTRDSDELNFLCRWICRR